MEVVDSTLLEAIAGADLPPCTVLPVPDVLGPILGDEHPVVFRPDRLVKY